MYIFSRNNINMKDDFAITITCTCRHQYAERHSVNLDTLSLDTCKQRKKKPEAVVFICCQYLLYLNSFVKIKFGDANLKALQSDFTHVSNFKIMVWGHHIRSFHYRFLLKKKIQKQNHPPPPGQKKLEKNYGVFGGK